MLRTKMGPGSMKIGIRTFKSLKNGNNLIEADSKEEIELLNMQMQDKCVDQIETKVQKRIIPRLNIYNVPDAVNAEDTILVQNPDLNLQDGDILTKITFKPKRSIRSRVIELKP
jgi:hypothetical protein